MGTEATGTGSRKERLRDELVQGARRAARDLIAAKGLDGVTVAAVARRLQVTPPALYRYFDGRRGLIGALYEDLTAELIRGVEEAVRKQPADDISAKLHAATRAVLTWSVTNRHEFALLMGESYPAAAESETEIPRVLTRELGGVFSELFTELWRGGGLVFCTDEQIPPALRRQLDTYRRAMRPELPLGVARLMLVCWRQIYGVVCMAVYGHLAFAFEEYDEMFEDMMVDLLALLGLEPSPRLR
jgi:AcrR family transcriptional regulator